MCIYIYININININTYIYIYTHEYVYVYIYIHSLCTANAPRAAEEGQVVVARLGSRLQKFEGGAPTERKVGVGEAACVLSLGAACDPFCD